VEEYYDFCNLYKIEFEKYLPYRLFVACEDLVLLAEST